MNPENTANEDIRIVIDGIQTQMDCWLDGQNQKARGIPVIPSLPNTAPKAFLVIPQIIHIGPYYKRPSDNNDLQHTLKLGFLQSLCSRVATQLERPFLERCTEAVWGMATNLMASYDRNAYKLSGKEFVKMMVIDGCFIVEYLHCWSKLVLEEQKCDLLSGREYLIPQINDDLLLLKNQLPFSLLKEIHLLAFSEQRSEHSFESCALDFVFHMINLHSSFGHRHHLRKRGRLREPSFPDSERTKWTELASKAFHFLDLYRTISIESENLRKTSILKDPNPDSFSKKRLWETCVAFCGENGVEKDYLIPSIPSATFLDESGIELKSNRSSRSVLSVDFKDGALDIPILVLNHSTLRLLKNLSELEKHNHMNPIFTAYIRFMDHIINTKDDIALLQRNGIIHHNYGSDERAANAFNGLIRDESQDANNYFSQIYEEINKHCFSTRRMVWVSFKKKYFRNPWSFIALISAIALLLLTFLQTFYTIQAYFHPPDA